MTSNAASGTASSHPRLGPGWRGGRGFQPPPAVPTARDTSHSSLPSDSTKDRASENHESDLKRDSNRNSFSALVETDDDGGHQLLSGVGSSTIGSNGKHPEDGGAFPRRGGSSSSRNYSSRSEGLRSTGGASFGRSVSTGATVPGSSAGGRSLSDLAKRVSVPSGAINPRTHSASGGPRTGFDESTTNSRPPVFKDLQIDKKQVLRFTREKLLSMRLPNPDTNGPPEMLKHLDITSVLLSSEPLDPGKKRIY